MKNQLGIFIGIQLILVINIVFKLMKEKLKAIWNILIHDEYFIVTAYKDTTYSTKGYGGWAPIRYDYVHNTNRNVFYQFVKNYIENLDKDNE